MSSQPPKWRLESLLWSTFAPSKFRGRQSKSLTHLYSFQSYCQSKSLTHLYSFQSYLQLISSCSFATKHFFPQNPSSKEPFPQGMVVSGIFKYVMGPILVVE